MNSFLSGIYVVYYVIALYFYVSKLKRKIDSFDCDENNCVDVFLFMVKGVQYE